MYEHFLMSVEKEIAEERGMKKGIETGMKKGIETGMKKGIETGMKKGIETGMKKGIETGIEKMVRSLLTAGIAPEIIAKSAKWPIERVRAFMN